MASIINAMLAIELITNAGTIHAFRSECVIGSPVIKDFQEQNNTKGDHKPSATNEIAKIIEIDSFMTN